MGEKNPKILLLGDYSNCHRTLATGLRAIGCEVTVASDGSGWMQCERNVSIVRRKGKPAGLFHALRMHALLRGSLSGYDIVAIHDLNFCNLKPHRMWPLFNLLKSRNGGVFLTSMSTDIAYLDMLQAADSPLRYSEWFVNGKPSRMFEANPREWEMWHNSQLVGYQNKVLDRLDGAVSVLYEYHKGIERRLGPDRVAYGGIPVDVDLFPQVELPDRPEKIRFFLGRDRRRKLMKGTDLLEEAARRVVDRYPSAAELVIVENKPFSEFIELMKSSHVVLDQIYSYTPATTALMAMAYGMNVVSGGEPEFYDFIGEWDNRPVINAPLELDALTDTLEDIVRNPQLIRERGIRSREFVMKHNDCRVVARRYLDFWQRRLHADR